MNIITLIGRAGKDPERRETKGGDAVASFSLATSERWKDASGEKKERTQWHRIVAFGAVADVIAKYVKKGDQVGISGQMTYRKWEDKEGVSHTAAEVVVRNGGVTLLGNKQKSGDGEADAEVPAAKQNESFTANDLDDEIPF